MKRTAAWLFALLPIATGAAGVKAAARGRLYLATKDGKIHCFWK